MSLALPLLLAPGRISAQHASSTLDAHRRAAAVLDAAVAAHGGVDALRAARHVRVTIAGHDIHRYQSRRITPYDSTVRTHDLMFDLARGRLVHQQTRGYPGGFYYTTRFISDSARHFAVDVRNHNYTSQQYPPADQQFGNLFMLPQFYLLAALANSAGQRQWLGRRTLASGATVDAITMVLPNGGLNVLGFDPATHQLRAIFSVGFEPFTGDAEVATEFLDYRMLNGVLLPTRSVNRRAGEAVSDLRFTSAALGYSIPDSLLAPPGGFTVAASAAPGEPVRELGPGVWGVRAAGAWTLVAAFSDHVLVIDAPTRGAQEVISRVATLAPGKPIRYVVPTHHHDDHFMGVRAFAAAGATTVTTPGNSDYFRRMVAAPKSTTASLQADPAPAARVEIITGKRRTFTDGTLTIELHDIGPNAHAEEMLVAWIPAEGILFTADLTEAPASGIAQRGANAQATMQLADYIRRQRWNVKVFAGAHAFMASPAAFEELVRYPILPPE